MDPMISAETAVHLPYMTFHDRRILDRDDPRTGAAEHETPSSIMFVFLGRNPLWRYGEIRQVSSANVNSLRDWVNAPVDLYDGLKGIDLVSCVAFSPKRIVLVIRTG